MKLHLLLEKLVHIAQKPKTDFAQSIRMTPSGLSKILTGKRLPTTRERKVFTKLAAEYFAESIYAPNCHLKFKDLYPVIYDFQSKRELLAFLTYGIEYAMDKNFAQESSVNFDYSERGFYFLGYKPVINWLCVILSEYLTCHPSDEPLELYSTLPLLGSGYNSILKRICHCQPKAVKGHYLPPYHQRIPPRGIRYEERGGSVFAPCQSQRILQPEFMEYFQWCYTALFAAQRTCFTAFKQFG
ncbi:MAG: hypothetical protein ACOX0K_10315 [Oscillospiraceae bacterium]